jgi:hypothetical protein
MLAARGQHQHAAGLRLMHCVKVLITHALHGIGRACHLHVARFAIHAHLFQRDAAVCRLGRATVGPDQGGWFGLGLHPLYLFVVSNCKHGGFAIAQLTKVRRVFGYFRSLCGDTIWGGYEAIGKGNRPPFFCLRLGFLGDLSGYLIAGVAACEVNGTVSKGNLLTIAGLVSTCSPLRISMPSSWYCDTWK